jgi:hypothetical protein
MNNQAPNTPITESPQSTQSPKEAWTEPVLRITPIAETAGSKATTIGDGTDAFSS